MEVLIVVWIAGRRVGGGGGCRGGGGCLDDLFSGRLNHKERGARNLQLSALSKCTSTQDRGRDDGGSLQHELDSDHQCVATAIGNGDDELDEGDLVGSSVDV